MPVLFLGLSTGRVGVGIFWGALPKKSGKQKVIRLSNWGSVSDGVGDVGVGSKHDDIPTACTANLYKCLTSQKINFLTSTSIDIAY